MFNLFGERVRLPYENGPRPCLSFYGHEFQRLNDNAIYCPRCGTIKKIED